MSTSDNIEIKTSTTDINLTSEMEVQLNPISQTDEANTPVSAEITRDDPSISTSLDNKPDENSAMIQLLLKLDKKLDEQKIDSDIKFNELKNEIKLGHNHLMKKCDKLITKLENLNLVESQLETQKVNSGTQQNAVLNMNLCKNNNSDNECTDKSNVTSSKIVVLSLIHI